MNTFFGGIFIDKEKLEEAGIKEPIKLEYYKTMDNNKYGIKVIKLQYINNDIKTEEKEIKNLSNSEQEVESILTILKNNSVTPIGVEDVISDFSKNILFK